jgi:anhydro-N-acetylmuramic acid kinase
VNGDLFIGLISGTSRDGVDAALVQFDGDRPNLLHAVCLPYGEPLKSDLDTVLKSAQAPSPADTGMLHEFLGRHFARAARLVAEQAGIEMKDVTAIGSHGQTVWHEPDGDNPRSLQLGEPRVIVRSNGVTTISDFRAADLRAGGQGAPLAPLLHRVLFRSVSEERVVLNLGGIANVTFLHSDGSVSGFDCGPANCLMDLWARRHLGQPFDEAGAWASGGTPAGALLDELLSDPYFSRRPPKSTGLEYFNASWLDSRLEGHTLDPADVQSTLAELAAHTVAECIVEHGRSIRRTLVCGGGVHNIHLLQRLASHMPDIIVEPTSRHGVNPDWVEAILFAWLARERLAERRQDTRMITGASEPVLLGEIHQP